MLFAFSFILLVGGMYLMGASFNITGLEGPLFTLGILLVAAAFATPMIASAVDYRGDESRR